MTNKTPAKNKSKVQIVAEIVEEKPIKDQPTQSTEGFICPHSGIDSSGLSPEFLQSLKQ
jgi:F420-0:gamma-glutamyl ligase